MRASKSYSLSDEACRLHTEIRLAAGTFVNMDEILELQQQLAAAQLGTSAQKLSERNCVELVMKLQALNLIDLIFTRSGKEYLTHKQLFIEIEDEILARGGRVNVIDLPEALNVELFHIQSKIPEIVSASDGSTSLVRGELLTDYYLACIAEDINDNLTSSEHGVDDIGSIASRYALPVDIVRDTVKTHLGSLINATLDAQNPDFLRSAASIARDRAAAQGLLRATTTPTVLADLAKLRELALPLIAEMAQKMLENGELSGSVVGRGTRAIYVPSVFAKAAVQAASSAFASNGFIKLDRLERMHIPDVSVFVAELLTDAVVLEECVIGPSLIDTLATSAAEAVSGGSWLDVELALPPDFPEGDVEAVITRLVQSLEKENETKEPETKPESGKSSRSRRKAKSTASGGTKEDDSPKPPLVFGDKFIVSRALTKRFDERIKADADQKAGERARLLSEKMSTVVTQTGLSLSQEKQEAAPAESGKKGKGKGRRRAGAKEKTNKRSVANGSNGIPEGAPVEPSIPPLSLEEVVEIILSEEQLSTAIETDYLGSSTAGEDMLSCLVEEVHGDRIPGLYSMAAELALATLMRERASAKMNREKALLTGLEEAELYAKSAATLPEEELVSASRSWIIDVICVNAFCRIVDSVAQGTGIVEASVVHAHELGSKREKLDAMRAVLPKLAPPLETRLRTLLAAVSDKDSGMVEEFLETYDENVELLDLPVRRPLDKKGEKVAYANAKARLMLSLDEEGLTKDKCLETATVLVHSKSSGGLIIVFPPDAVTGFSKAIEGMGRPAELGAMLRELREAVESVEGEANGEAMGSGLSTEVAEKLVALREYIG